MEKKKKPRGGKRFSKENQPKKNGRKKSRFQELFEQCEFAGEPLSLEDYRLTVRTLQTLSPQELRKVAMDDTKPSAIITVANAILSDIDNGTLSNNEKLLDRAFGKEAIRQEITGKDGKDLITQINIQPFATAYSTFADNEKDVIEER